MFTNYRVTNKLIPDEFKSFLSEKRAKSKSDLSFFGKVALVLLAAAGVIFIISKYLQPDYEDEYSTMEENNDEEE